MPNFVSENELECIWFYIWDKLTKLTFGFLIITLVPISYANKKAHFKMWDK